VSARSGAFAVAVRKVVLVTSSRLACRLSVPS
jgi:hypothetical protein